MRAYPLSELANAIGAQLQLPPSLKEAQGPELVSFCGLSTDSRGIKRGEVFLAIRGPRFDGHQYLDQAIKCGAAAICVQDPERAERWRRTIPVLFVEDTERALAKAASWYRDKFEGEILAVSGSVGKTTTRDLLFALLREALGGNAGQVARTEANLNNYFGIAGRILSLDEEARYAVLEAGIAKPGDMKKRAAMIRPDLALLTFIGYSHLEAFGSRQGILNEKLELVRALRPGGCAVLNGNDPLLLDWIEGEEAAALRARGLRFACTYLEVPVPVGGEGNGCSAGEREAAQRLQARLARGEIALLSCQDAEIGAESSLGEICFSQMIEGEIKTECVGVNVPRSGAHILTDAMLACAAVAMLGIPLRRAVPGLALYRETGRRQKRIDLGGFTLIDDSYNASPESVEAAMRYLAVLAADEGRRSVAALAGIRELGADAEGIHRALGRRIGAFCPSVLYLCGEFAPAIASGLAEVLEADVYAARVRVFRDRESLCEALIPLLNPRDILLVKGSHAYEMHKVGECALEAIREA